MRGVSLGRARVALAAAGVIVVAAVAVTLGASGSGGQQRPGVRHPAAALAAGTGAASAGSAHASPATVVRVIHPSHVPALRTMRPSRPTGKTGWKAIEPERSAVGPASPGAKAGSALVQRSAPKGLMPDPIANFAGLSNTCGCSPPDTEGDIGTDYYMQWVNLSFRVYHRDGTPATAVMPGYSLFTGQPICGSPAGNGGDPIVQYDQFANRWIASQLAYPTYPVGPFYQCVAISQTGDPTGTWCAYQYVASQTKLNDYPKFGVWPTQHAYMVTVNQFSEPGDGWAGVGLFALERDQMLNCGTTRMLYRNMFNDDPNLWGGMLPADVDGSTLPPANAPAPLIEVDDNAWGRLERDRRLERCRNVERGARRHDRNGALRLQPLRIQRLHPAARDDNEARHAQRPAHVPPGLPELRRSPGARRRPLRRCGRPGSRRRALVRAQEDDRQLGHRAAGNVRAGHDREPLDGLDGDGSQRRPRRRLLDEQQHRVPGDPVRGPARH